MALDPLSAIVNGVGLFMDHDAKARAADAANINRLMQQATGAQNVNYQMGDTNQMLGVNDQILQLLQQADPKDKALLDDIIRREVGNVSDSAKKRVGASQDAAGARGELAKLLAARDLSTAGASTRATNRAATADQTDVYGNRTFYDPAGGGFKTSLSSPQTDLVRGYNETEKSRQDALQEAIARSRFDRSPSEASIRSELTGLMTDADATKFKDIQDVMGRQALRMGRGGDIATIIKTINDQLGESAPRSALDARNQAAKEYIERENARTSRSAADIGSFATPLAPSSSITAADSNRRAQVTGLANTLAQNAGLAERATTTASNRLGAATDKNIEDLLSTLGETEKQKLGVGTTTDAMLLNQSGTSLQRMLDALKQRQDIWGSDASRVSNAITNTASNMNTAATNQVSAIGKESPNATMLSNLAKSLSLNDNAKKGKGGDSEDNSDLVNALMEKIAAG